jgi:hypothetical protein
MQVVVDLGMPGPERLVSEAGLMGALGIVSSRWNGASESDFPYVRKVGTHATYIYICGDFMHTHISLSYTIHI